jgi:hypothetical protein
VKRDSYHQYDHTALDNAYLDVKDDGTSVHGTAKRFHVPLTTLRDRVDGRIHIDTVHGGNPCSPSVYSFLINIIE